MTHPGVEAACRGNARRLAATGAFLAIWGVAAAVPLLAQSSSTFWYVLWCRRTYALTGAAGRTVAWFSLALFVSGVVLAGWTFLRGVLAAYRLNRQFSLLAAPPPPPVLAAARAAGVAERFLYVAQPQSVALTLGLFRPLVILSAGAAEGLTEGELSAVLLHEAAHCRSRDPLRQLLWSALVKGFGLLPGFPAMARAARSCAELRADDLAVRRLNSTDALAHALLKMARRTADLRKTPASAGFHDELVLRARHLVGQDVSGAILPMATKRPVPWFMWLTGLLALLSLLLPACLPR